MITIGEMQISGMLTMMVLTMMLVACVPRRSMIHAGFGRARWLMASGTTLIAVQFLLQHLFGFRQMGVTQAVLWNLLLFMPATMLVNMAILYLQRRGIVGRRHWLVGTIVCGLNTLVLVTTLLADGVPIESESLPLQWAEYAGAMLFIVMQGYYFRLHLREYLRLQRAVDEYFDRERRDLLGWMVRSAMLLALMTIMVPVAIFFQGKRWCCSRWHYSSASSIAWSASTVTASAMMQCAWRRPSTCCATIPTGPSTALPNTAVSTAASISIRCFRNRRASLLRNTSSFRCRTYKQLYYYSAVMQQILTMTCMALCIV